MKYRPLLALSLSALLLTGCTKPAPNGDAAETETSATETTVATAETTTTVTITAMKTEASSATEIVTEVTVQEQPDPVAEKIWDFLSDSDYSDGHTTDLYFLFDFNGDDFPEVAFVGWYIDIPYVNVYDLSSGKAVSLGSTHQGLSPYSNDKECIGLYCNEKGEYFYHSLSYYAIKNSNGWKHIMERYITPVDFDNHTVEFIPDPTEQRSFDNEADAEKYKESVFKELEQLTLVTELKTSYMVADREDEEAFRAMLADLPNINYVTK